MAQKRNFTDFLDAYFQYADDAYCPDQFHIWTGLTLLSAALERKVWLKQLLENAVIIHYTNIYTLLVSHPGVGKTTAMDRGVELIEDLKEFHNPNMMIIPNQVTEPALLDLMKISQVMDIAGNQLVHSSGFFYASEASASALQNLYGEFTSTITALYDCPKSFRKKLKGERDTTEIRNACMTLLAGSTFNYLKELVNEKSVEGGLASRLIYVISRERKVRKSKWFTNGTGEPSVLAREFRRKLSEDLVQIHALRGPMTADASFITEWEKDQPEFERRLIALKSNRLESLNARIFTNMMKVAMLVCISEGDSLRLTGEHWKRARGLVEGVSKDNSYVIEQAIVADRGSQHGLTQGILSAIGNKVGDARSRSNIYAFLARNGNNVNLIKDTIAMLVTAGQISEDGSTLKLLIDPKDNL